MKCRNKHMKRIKRKEKKKKTCKTTVYFDITIVGTFKALGNILVLLTITAK